MKIIESKSNPYVIIEPSEAQAILDSRRKNRPVKTNIVKRYAKAMLEGKWKPNTTIHFLGDQLEDGQHRMLACVMAGVPFEGFVHKHNDTDMFATHDAGSKRSCADVLAIEDKAYTAQLASTLNVLEAYESGLLKNRRGGIPRQVQPYEVMDVLKKYSDIEYSVNLVGKAKSYFKAPIAGCSVLHYFLRKRERRFGDYEHAESPLANKFVVEHLFKGHGLYEGHPADTLRRHIIKCNQLKVVGVDRMPQGDMIYAGLVAWNRWIKGEKLLRVVIPEVKNFPKILL